MTNVNSALWGSLAHRKGSLGRTNRAIDYIGEVGEGGIDNYDQAFGYPVDSVIIRNDRFYTANATIPPGTPFVEGTTGLTWTEVSSSSAGLKLLDWTGTKDYEKDEFAVRSGILMRAIRDTTNGAGGVPADWAIVRAGLSDATRLRAWVPSTPYVKDTLVYSNASIWRARNNITSSGTWDIAEEANWQELGSSDAASTITDHNGANAYEENDVVVSSGRLFIARTDVTAGTQITHANWRNLDTGRYTGNFSTSSTYFTGDVALRNGTLVRANSNVSPGPYSEVDWTVDIVSFELRSWAGNTVYRAGTIVTQDGLSYVRRSSGISGAAWNVTEEANWDMFVSATTILDYTLGNNYRKHMTVVYDTGLYRANKDVTNVPAIPNPADWIQITFESKFKGLYSATGRYEVNDISYHQKILYRCTVAVTADKAFDSADWEAFEAEGSLTITSHSSAGTYGAGEPVTYNGEMYYANDAIDGSTVAVPFVVGTTGQTWRRIGNSFRGEYKNYGLYDVSDVIIRSGKLLRCITQITTSETFDKDKWRPISGNSIVPNFSTANDHYDNQLVMRFGALYRANADIPSGTAFAIGTTGFTFSPVLNVLGEHDSSVSYPAGVTVAKNNVLFTCRFSATGNINSNNWALVSSKLAQTHSDSGTYDSGDVVKKYSGIYVANAAMDGSGVAIPFAVGAAGQTWTYVTDSDSLYRGQFKTHLEYEVNDIVERELKLYKCKTKKNIGAWDETNFDVVGGEENSFKGKHIVTVTYDEDDIVYDDLKLYRCVADGTVGNLTDNAGADWEEFSYSICHMGAWDQTVTYKPGQTFVYKNLVLSYPLGGTGPLDKTAVHLHRTSGTIATHLISSAYAEGDVVRHESVIYSANANVPVNTPFAIGTSGATWSRFGPANERTSVVSIYRGELVPGERYEVGDIFTSNGITYRSGISQVIASAGSLSSPARRVNVVSDSGHFSSPIHGSQYKQGCTIAYGGILWMCNNAAGQVGTDLDLDNWTPIANATAIDWTLASSYFTGDIVLVEGTVYSANGTLAANTPFSEGTNSGEWTNRGSLSTVEFRGAYSETNTYSVGDVVHNNRTLFICKTAVTVAEAFDEAKWDVLGARKAIDVIDVAKEYDAGDIIVHTDNTLLMANDTVAAGTAVVIGTIGATWKRVSGAGTYPLYVAGIQYDRYTTVTFEGALLRCNVANVDSAIDPAKWTLISSVGVTVYNVTDPHAISSWVNREGGIYSANSSIAANTPFAEGAGANEWTLRYAPPSDGGFKGAFSATESYSSGDLVTRNSRLIAANSDLSPATFNDSDWTFLLAKPGRVVTTLAENDYIKAGDIYVSNGCALKAVSDVQLTANIGNDLVTNFVVLSSSSATFDTTVNYTAGDLVIACNKIAYANSNIPNSLGDFTEGAGANEWTLVGDNVAPGVHGHIPGLAYSKGDLAESGMNVYSATADVPANQPITHASWNRVTGGYKGEHSDLGRIAAGETASIGSTLLMAKTTQLDLTSANWEILHCIPSAITAYDISNAIVSGELYNVGGLIYVANDDMVANTPFVVGTTGQTFALLGDTVKGSFKGRQSDGRDYLEDDVVIDADDNSIKISDGAGNWTVLGSHWNVRGLYQTSVAYAGNDAVQVGDILYRVTAPISSAANTQFQDLSTEIIYSPSGPGRTLTVTGDELNAAGTDVVAGVKAYGDNAIDLTSNTAGSYSLSRTDASITSINKAVINGLYDVTDKVVIASATSLTLNVAIYGNDTLELTYQGTS